MNTTKILKTEIEVLTKLLVEKKKELKKVSKSNTKTKRVMVSSLANPSVIFKRIKNSKSCNIKYKKADGTIVKRVVAVNTKGCQVLKENNKTFLVLNDTKDNNQIKRFTFKDIISMKM